MTKKVLNDRIRDTAGMMLDNIGVAPGNEAWAIRDVCHECPERDDHCGIGCDRKGKRYLEKTMVDRVIIEIREDDIRIGFADTDGNEYTMDDLNATVFMDRDEALEVL